MNKQQEILDMLIERTEQMRQQMADYLEDVQLLLEALQNDD